MYLGDPAGTDKRFFKFTYNYTALLQEAYFQISITTLRLFAN